MSHFHPFQTHPKLWSGAMSHAGHKGTHASTGHSTGSRRTGAKGLGES